MHTIEIMTAAVEVLAQREFNERYPACTYEHRYAEDQQIECHVYRLRDASSFDNFERGCKVAIRSYFRLADTSAVDELYERHFLPFRTNMA